MSKKYELDLVNPNDILHRNNCIIRVGSDLNKTELEICEKALNGDYVPKWKIERLLDEYGRMTGIAMSGLLIRTLINDL